MERYKQTALIILQNFLDYSLEDSTKDIEENCVNSHKEMLREVIKPLAPPSKKVQFLFGCFQSCAGALVFSLLVAAVMFITIFKDDLSIKFVPKNNTNNEYIVNDSTVGKTVDIKM